MQKNLFEELLETLQMRFTNHMSRHEDIEWSAIWKKLEDYPEKLVALSEMERTAGEPDVIGYETSTNEYLFADCSTESPKCRRNLCYDRKAQESRKTHKPEGSVVESAHSMGIELMDEREYRHLQTLDKFDLKTSSWIYTPLEVRNLGGALFAEQRYGTVFIFHNSAPSYYGSRGFRGILRV